jgi:hypothetical protein
MSLNINSRVPRFIQILGRLATRFQGFQPLEMLKNPINRGSPLTVHFSGLKKLARNLFAGGF